MGSRGEGARRSRGHPAKMARQFSTKQHIHSKLSPTGANVSSNVTHGRARYSLGCRCDQCKCAESEYQKARRRRIAESIGECAVNGSPDNTVVHDPHERRLTCVNTENDPANIFDTSSQRFPSRLRGWETIPVQAWRLPRWRWPGLWITRRLCPPSRPQQQHS